MLFADPKYNDFSLWEKFYQKFQIDLVKMAVSHSYYMTGFYFYKGIEKLDISTDKVLVKHLHTLFRIYCLDTIIKDGHALGISGHLKPEHFRMIHELVYEEYKTIRPQMLNIIEAFELNDNILNSSIGSYDGNIYE